MTGYGRFRLERDGIQVSAEVRSLNQRFLEIKLNLPRGWGEAETELRKLVSGVARRGRVEVSIRAVTSRRQATLVINEPLARSYIRELKALKERLRLAGELDVDALLQRPEVFQMIEDEPDVSAEMALGKRALSQALKALEAERMREGRVLKRDMTSRLSRVKAGVRQMVHLSEESREAITTVFQKRVRELVTNLGMDEMRLVDEKRLYEEASVAAQRADITEELTRLRSHLGALGELFSRSEPVGKEIEFWLQEVGREVNTVGSKSQNAALSQVAVGIKGELEKMREQAQNIE